MPEGTIAERPFTFKSALQATTGAKLSEAVRSVCLQFGDPRFDHLKSDRPASPTTRAPATSSKHRTAPATSAAWVELPCEGGPALDKQTIHALCGIELNEGGGEGRAGEAREGTRPVRCD